MMNAKSNVFEVDVYEPAAKRFKHHSDYSQAEHNFSSFISAEEIDAIAKGKIEGTRSNRAMEKQRRDRMNNSLAKLSKLIPKQYSKQDKGRIQKTEIIQMAIAMITDLQAEVNTIESGKVHDPISQPPLAEHVEPCPISKFYMGFKECQDEVMRFLVENEDHNKSSQVCVCLMKYLSKVAKTFLPTLTRDNIDIHCGSTSPNESTSRRSSESLYPSSAGDLGRDVSCDSGFANMRSAFASLFVPLGIRQTECRNSISSRAHDFSSNSERSSMSSCSDSNIYKFKDNMTEQYLHDQKVQPSDTSSSCSNEEKNSRRRILKTLNCNYSANSSQYSSSIDSSYYQNVQQTSDKTGKLFPTDCDISISKFLPGFVLHPSGTHYFPLSINSAHVPDSLLTTVDSASVIYHPLSIPVHVCGSVIRLGGEKKSSDGRTGNNLKKHKL